MTREIAASSGESGLCGFRAANGRIISARRGRKRKGSGESEKEAGRRERKEDLFPGGWEERVGARWIAD